MEKLYAQPRHARLTSKSPRTRVRNAIERMIVEGRVRPGEKLVQRQLSRQFGVSLGIVREALFELEGLGLVESFENRSTRVRLLDAQAMHELQAVREMFDGTAARECCGKLSEQDAANLRQIAEQIYASTLAGDYEKKNLLDRDFHLRIVELSGNRVLIALARQHQVLGKVTGSMTDAARVRSGHFAIIDAILAGDANEAERAARCHHYRAPFAPPRPEDESGAVGGVEKGQ